MAPRFMWYELQTTDTVAAEAFYKTVVGWTTDKMGEGPLTYTIFNAGRGGVAGMPILDPGDVAAGPLWMGYIGVDDVDAYAERVKAKGGTVHIPPADIPGVGRFSMVTDPLGAAFTLFKGNQPEGPPTAQDGETGYFGWHELLAGGPPDVAFGFYADVFGFAKLDSFDMGPAGQYLLWGVEGGGEAVGGMMKKAADTPRPLWNYYIGVDGIDAGAARVAAAGGTVFNGPHEVPGGSWIVEARDPQGARFALIAPAR
ncbi:MAG TPA: VOC family protein [Caulobacteraceae bacterium]|nr:VOC family protein [Caulobacteraceae bacterium]